MLSWILICIGLVTWCVRTIIDIISIFIPGFGFESPEPYSWGGIAISFCLCVGVYLIKEIFVQLKAAEEERRAYEKKLLTAVIEAEENERKRFAAELHDGLGPILSGVKMCFSAISDDVKDADIRENLSKSISEAITTVREVSNNLSPHVLNNFGIEKAVANFVAKLNFLAEGLGKEPVKIKYNIHFGAKRYPHTLEIVVYRVLCELITNTIKHAEAREIEFSLWHEQGNLLLNYSDDGKGFDPEQVKQQIVPRTLQGGMGYYNIESRVSSLKGTVTYSARQSGVNGERRGLVVNINIPITND